MFTKQHYRVIAEIIKGNGLTPTSIRNIVENLADYFAADNPHFDRDKFLEACGI